MLLSELTHIEALSQMESISLSQMKEVKLMNRIDTKYVALESSLEPFLNLLKDNYYIQKIAGSPIASYNTLYYDTANLDLYIKHHNKVLQREKVRVREYIDTHVTFLEVKHKRNTGRTKKKRIEVDNSLFETILADAPSRDFLTSQLDFSVEKLQPQLYTKFNRITLVNKAKTERLTIDLNLSFENKKTGVTHALEQIMIVELKQDGNFSSDAKKILSSLRIMPYKISKYCLGQVLTNSTIKYNRFKPKVLYINKLRTQE